jgi:predicted metal-binding protein
MDDFITVVKTGANITTSATSARVAIPTAQSGEIPRYIRIAAINPCHVCLGTVASNAVITDTLVQPADAITLAVPRGMTHVCAIQDAAAGLVNIVPLEDC